MSPLRKRKDKLRSMLGTAAAIIDQYETLGGPRPLGGGNDDNSHPQGSRTSNEPNGTSSPRTHKSGQPSKSIGPSRGRDDITNHHQSSLLSGLPVPAAAPPSQLLYSR